MLYNYEIKKKDIDTFFAPYLLVFWQDFHTSSSSSVDLEVHHLRPEIKIKMIAENNDIKKQGLMQQKFIKFKNKLRIKNLVKESVIKN